jgi:hypothetical protein
MVGGKESKLQHAWGLASLLAPLSRRDSMAVGWSWKPCRRRSETRSFGEAYIDQRLLTTLELRIHALVSAAAMRPLCTACVAEDS